ncbi:MAG: hypothetical protein LBP86_03530, partial [Azoarcus sp.]|nr:hypothetical protein [Azoarcus sp.]
MKTISSLRAIASQGARESLYTAHTVSALPPPAKRLLTLILVTLMGISTSVAAQDADPQPASTEDEIVLPKVTVTDTGTSGGIGSAYHTQGNTDIIRSKVDAQPYTIIERQEIENSGATTVEEL